MLRPQKGFVLVSVLIITSLSTLLAFHEMSNNRLQERIGGNQQKEINARMNAEQGVIKAYEFIKIQQLNNVDPTVIALNLLSTQNVNSSNVKIHNPQFSAAVITFVSEGKSNGAIAQLKASINLLPGQKVLTGIVGCDGISLSGSGVIDSFDSTKGAYGEVIDGKKNYGGQGNAATISDSGDITLAGSAPIYGNVSAGKDFSSSGSSVVIGDVSANGNVNVNANDTNMTDREGNVIEHSVNGDVNSGADAILNDKNIAGDVNAKGEATGTLYVDGTTIAKDGEADSLYQGPNINVSETCDNLGLAEQRKGYGKLIGKDIKKDIFSNIRNDEDFYFTHDASKNDKGVEFTFTAETAEVLNIDHAKEGAPLLNEQAAVSGVDFLGESGQDVHVFDDFFLDFQDISITGGKEVKILVKGNFNVKNTSSIKVEKGSSLSIVVMGEINTSDGFNIVEVGTGDSVAGKSAVSIYSTYEQKVPHGHGVNLMGTNINATINAPFSKVHVMAAGSFQGAMRGKLIKVSGAGGVHFDEKLLKGNPPIDPSASIAAITYYYD